MISYDWMVWMYLNAVYVCAVYVYKFNWHSRVKSPQLLFSVHMLWLDNRSYVKFYFILNWRNSVATSLINSTPPKVFWSLVKPHSILFWNKILGRQSFDGVAKGGKNREFRRPLRLLTFMSVIAVCGKFLKVGVLLIFTLSGNDDYKSSQVKTSYKLSCFK